MGEIQTICVKAGGWLKGGKTPVEHVLPWEERASVQGGNTGREQHKRQAGLPSP